MKLNSPYMETVCVISTANLYQQVIDQDIPFHKWYFWVEKQLLSAYIQLLYKNQVTAKSTTRVKLAPNVWL